MTSDPSTPFGEITLASGQLRELAHSELPALQSLLERAADHLLLAEGREPTATEARDLWDEVPSGTPRSHKHVLGLFGPELVGVADVVRDWPRPRTWIIGLLLLDPAVRGRGAGTSTVEAIDAWAARSGADRLRLTVVTVNTAALAFWRGLGFAEVPLHPGAGGTDLEVLAFERPIRSGR